MMTPTVWIARRVGDRILCGRQVPPGGPYACMGEIASIRKDMAGNEVVFPRPGLVDEYVYGEEGSRYRETTRARFPGKRAFTIPGGIFPRTRHFPGAVGVPLRFWAPCSHGKHVNWVPRTILDVLG